MKKEQQRIKERLSVMATAIDKYDQELDELIKDEVYTDQLIDHLNAIIDALESELSERDQLEASLREELFEARECKVERAAIERKVEFLEARLMEYQRMTLEDSARIVKLVEENVALKELFYKGDY